MQPHYFIKARNIKIAVYDEGNKRDETILFIHGNSLGAFTFRDQLNDQKLNKYRRISFDLPGHGHSGKAGLPEDEYSMKGFVDTVNEIVHALDIKNILFAGHSFGGHLLLEAYEQLKDAAVAFVIFGTPPMSIPPAFDEMFLPNEAGGLIFKENLNNGEINILAASFLKKNAVIFAEIIQSIQNTDPQMRKFLGADLMAGNAKNEADIISHINVPVAIFHGRDDQLINASYFDKLHVPSLWQNKIHFIEDAGHSPQMENPGAFNQLLIQFCKEVFH